MNLNGWLFFVNLFVHWMTFLLYKRDFLTIICWKCTHPFTHTIALHEEVCTVLQLLLSYWSIKNLILRQPSSPETLPLRCPPLQPDQEGVWHWGTIFSPGRWNISWRPQIQCLIWRLSLTSGLIIPYQREREKEFYLEPWSINPLKHHKPPEPPWLLQPLHSCQTWNTWRSLGTSRCEAWWDWAEKLPLEKNCDGSVISTDPVSSVFLE